MSETDEWGLTEQDRRQLRANERKWMREQRWRAFKALWFKPVKEREWNGRERTRDARGDDWTIGRAIKATIGIILNRRKVKEIYWPSFDMAFWDARSVYGGYDVTVLWLYPGCRISIFSDGEINL